MEFNSRLAFNDLQDKLNGFENSFEEAAEKSSWLLSVVFVFPTVSLTHCKHGVESIVFKI